MMSLEPHHIHLWSAQNDLTPAQFATALTLLTANEQAHALQLRIQSVRQQYIFSRSTLRTILSHYLAIRPNEITLHYTAQQKPILATHPDLHFNVAHSGELVLVALLANAQVGVDIEKHKSTVNFDISKRFFSKKEHQDFSALSEADKVAGFFRIWSRKEALLKALGTGLSYSLPSFSVSIEPKMETIILENQHWSLFPLNIHPAYAAAIAANQPINKISFFDFSIFKNQQVKSK